MLPAWHIFLLEVSSIILARNFQALSGWMGNINTQPFSGFSRDAFFCSGPNSGSVTAGNLQRCTEATPVVSGQNVLGPCLVEM